MGLGSCTISSKFIEVKMSKSQKISKSHWSEIKSWRYKMPDPCQIDLTDELIPKIPLSGLYHFFEQDVRILEGCTLTLTLLCLQFQTVKLISIAWGLQLLYNTHNRALAVAAVMVVVEFERLCYFLWFPNLFNNLCLSWNIEWTVLFHHTACHRQQVTATLWNKQVKPGFTNFQPQPKFSCA